MVHAAKGSSGFHARIREARRVAGLTQVNLAALLGVSQSTIASWEAPDGNEPSLANFENIAAATGSTVEWLAFGRRMVTEVVHAADKPSRKQPAA